MVYLIRHLMYLLNPESMFIILWLEIEKFIFLQFISCDTYLAQDEVSAVHPSVTNFLLIKFITNYILKYKRKYIFKYQNIN